MFYDSVMKDLEEGGGDSKFYFIFIVWRPPQNWLAPGRNLNKSTNFTRKQHSRLSSPNKHHHKVPVILKLTVI